VAESFGFELRLVDSVTAPARRAAEAVRQIETRAKKAQSAIGGDLGKQFEKIGFAAARAAKKQTDAFAESWAKIGMAAERANRRAAASAERAAKHAEEKRKEHSFLGGIKEGTGFARLTSAAFLGAALAEGAVGIVESLIEGAHKVVEVITDGVKDAFRDAAKEQTRRIGEKNVLGAEGAKAFREDADSIAAKSPFDDSTIRKLMLPLRRAGLSQAASRQALATATDIGGGDEGAVGGITEQFQHIYTKKGIGKKQLVELLGNVGSTIPDFYKSLGKQMHVSAKEAEKRSEEGKLDPQLLMNMISEAQNKRQGGKAGTGGLEYAKSLEVQWRKVNELPGEYFKKLVDSPGLQRASEMLGGLLEKLNPESPAGQRIMSAIEGMFEKITSLFGDPTETAEGLANGIEQAVNLTGDLISAAKDLADAFLPSLETIQDMILGLRQFIAIQSGDKAGLQKAVMDEVVTKATRMSRANKKAGMMAARFEGENTFNATADPIAANMSYLASAPVAVGGGGGHTTNAASVTVNVESNSENPEEHGRKAGRAAAKEIERARQHWGN
jgi:hypothetical protein